VQPEVGWVGLLVAVLQDAPYLPGALCTADPRGHDCEEGEGIERAIAVCERCPSLRPCDVWAQGRSQLSGVVAGRYQGRKRYDHAHEEQAGADDETRRPTTQ
jgi:hypothetical protein